MTNKRRKWERRSLGFIEEENREEELHEGK